jgi:Na+/H+-dicarboxylate symporter
MNLVAYSCVRGADRIDGQTVLLGAVIPMGHDDSSHVVCDRRRDNRSAVTNSMGLIVVAVDHLLDIGPTASHGLGDAVAATLVAQWEDVLRA